MSTFLAALKNKSASLQVTKKTGYNPESETNQIVIDSNFGTVDQTIHDDATLTRVERILNKNKLHLYFTKKPSVKLHFTLLGNGFKVYIGDNQYYGDDSKESCKFVTRQFNLPEDELHATTANSRIDPSQEVAETENTAINDFEAPNEAIKKYRMQCDALKQALNAEIGDLALLAIDCLYTKTFNN